MAFSCLCPAILLLGIRGEGLKRLPDSWYLAACLVVALAGMAVPLVILYRYRKGPSNITLEVGGITANPEHPFVYAIAVILPIWAGNTDDWRNALATLTAFFIVWILFAISNLHHSNLVLRLFGYQIYTITPPAIASAQGAIPYIVLSREHLTAATTHIDARILDSNLVIHIPSSQQKIPATKS